MLRSSPSYSLLTLATLREMSASPLELSEGRDEVKTRTALVFLINNGWGLKSEIELEKTYHFENHTKSVEGTLIRNHSESDTPGFVQRDPI
jgi:hypothetical protein